MPLVSKWNGAYLLGGEDREYEGTSYAWVREKGVLASVANELSAFI